MANVAQSLQKLFVNFQISKRERDIRDICAAMNDACKRGTKGLEATPEI